MELHCGEGAGQGRIGVAVNQDGCRLLFEQDCFQSLQHARSHGAVCSARYTEVERRRGNAEFGKENVRHVVVKVLPGMDEHFFKDTRCRQDATNGGGLDELRPSPHDGQDAVNQVCVASFGVGVCWV